MSPGTSVTGFLLLTLIGALKNLSVIAIGHMKYLYLTNRLKNPNVNKIQIFSIDALAFLLDKVKRK